MLSTRRFYLSLAGLLLAFLVTAATADDTAPTEEPDTEEEKARVLRIDKKQPWLRADSIGVKTVQGSPVFEVRVSNEHETRVAEDVKKLSAGVARDNYGSEYKVFAKQRPEQLEAGESIVFTYQMLPKPRAVSTELLFVANVLGERALYIEVERDSNDDWELVDYGTWKEERAYFEQSEWAEERVKVNPYKEAAAELRTWRDDSGKFAVSASFVDFKLDKATGRSIVTLKRADDGKEIDVPLQELAEADQKYVRDLRKKAHEKKDDERLEKMQKRLRSVRARRRRNLIIRRP